jgi:hypothetical protein
MTPEETRKRSQFSSRKHAAKKAGIEWGLVFSDIVWPTHCEVLGHPLDYSAKGRSGNRDWSPSLDRTDSNVGYVVGNVRVISNRANALKGNATAEELRLVAEYSEDITRENEMSQNNKVRAYLMSRGHISPLQARVVHGVERLAARVFDLKAQGMDIRHTTATDEAGKDYTRYVLVAS